ncbi:MAG: hypothetical protein KAJ18_05045 [Candidatus Omnitrophica bacterium]|nr:hypothetical protein [Candidatus Omnitrophota bacterium]
MIKKRTTVYIEEKLVKLLKLRSIKTDQSTSDYINKVLYQDMLEEQEDLKSIQKILKEPTLSFDDVLQELNIKDDV